MPVASSVDNRPQAHEDVYLIHGWGMHSGCWGVLPERLRDDGFRPHLIDLPGHGGAPPLFGADLTAMTHALADQINKPGRLIGWSLGGALALMFAAGYPERVTNLTLTGTSPCFVQRADWPLGMDLDTFGDFRSRLHDDPAEAVNGFLGLQVRGSADERRTLRELRRMTGQAPVPETKALLEGLNILMDNDMRTMAGTIKTPVTIIHGGCDGLVPVAAARYLAGALPTARLTVVEGAGHAPFLSHAEIFYAALHGGFDA